MKKFTAAVAIFTLLSSLTACGDDGGYYGDGIDSVGFSLRHNGPGQASVQLLEAGQQVSSFNLKDQDEVVNFTASYWPYSDNIHEQCAILRFTFGGTASFWLILEKDMLVRRHPPSRTSQSEEEWIQLRAGEPLHTTAGFEYGEFHLCSP